jgi:ATP-dependent Clp protease adaptor protein ClpS
MWPERLQFTRMLRCEVPLARMKSMATKPPSGPVPAPPVVRPKEDDGGSVVLERRAQRTKPPQMYQVVMLNDDYTPMEFVVVVIQEFFHKDRETATQIMLKIHLDGRGICGVFPRDIANTKVEQVQEAARQAGHPLQCVSEPVE